MIELNSIIRASAHTKKCVEKCLTEFDEHLYGIEFGVAYGGGIERIGELWKGRGTIWGADTFEGHPDFEDADGHARGCMEIWYRQGGEFDKKFLQYDHIRGELDKKGLDNVILCKGLVTDKTDVSFIPKLHYVLLDLDYKVSMRQAYELVKDKIVKGGYLCLHDVIPENHLDGLNDLYKDILTEGFEVVEENPICYMAVLKKK